MKYKVRKLVAFVMALFMVFQSAPVPVLAEGEGNGNSGTIFSDSGSTDELTVHTVSLVTYGDLPQNLYICFEQVCASVTADGNTFENAKQYYYEKIDSNKAEYSVTTRTPFFLDAKSYTIDNCPYNADAAISVYLLGKADCTEVQKHEFASNSGASLVFIGNGSANFTYSYWANDPNNNNAWTQFSETIPCIVRTTGNNTTIILGTSPIEYTARMDVYEAWADAPSDTLDFGNAANGVFVRATAGDKTFDAPLRKGDLAFSDGANLSVTLPAISEWKLVYGDGNDASVEGFEFELTPTEPGDDHEYVLKARGERTYGVEIDYYDVSGNQVNEPTVTPVTFTAGGYQIDVQANRSIVLSADGVPVDRVSAIDTWSPPEFMIGEYEVIFNDNNPTVDNNRQAYVIRAQQPETYSVAIQYINKEGTESASASLDQEYTLTATTDYGTYTASVGTDGALGSWALGTGTKNYLPDLPAVNSFEFSLQGAAVNDKVGTYKLPESLSNLTAENRLYTITLTEPQLCDATITVEGSLAVPSGYAYYFVAKNNDGVPIGYAKIGEDNTFKSIPAASASSDGLADGFNNKVPIDEETQFEVVKLGDSVTPTAQILQSVDQSAKVTASGGMMDGNKFTWALTEKAEGGKEFKLVAKGPSDYSLISMELEPHMVDEGIKVRFIDAKTNGTYSETLSQGGTTYSIVGKLTVNGKDYYAYKTIYRTEEDTLFNILNDFKDIENVSPSLQDVKPVPPQPDAEKPTIAFNISAHEANNYVTAMNAFADPLLLYQHVGDKVLVSAESVNTPEYKGIKIYLGDKLARTVNIHLYSYDGETPTNNDPNSDDYQNYQKQMVVLARLIDKNESDPKKQVIGYQAVSVKPDGTDWTYQTQFNDVFTKVSYYEDENYSSYQQNMGKIYYDPDLHDIKIRLLETERDANIPSSFDDVLKLSSDISGYQFFDSPNGNVTNGDITDLNLKKAYPTVYQVKVLLKPDDAEHSAIPEDKFLYLYVKGTHETTGDDIYMGLLTISDAEASAGEKIVTIYDPSGESLVNNWSNKTDNGNGPNPGGEFTDNTETDAYLILGKNGSLTYQSDGNNYRKLNDGAYFAGYTISYKDRDTQQPTDESKKTVITDIIELTKINATHDYSYSSILGSGVYYGITAQFFDQGGHIQSNFAANKYYPGNIVEPDLAGNGSVIVIADPQPAADGYYLEIGGSHVDGTDTVVYLGKNGTEDNVRNVAQRDWVHVIPSNTADLNSNIVQPIIRYGINMSNELLQHEPTIRVDTQEIDLLDLPENATIYLDADAIKGWIGKENDGLYITKHQGQTIVFNFDSSSSVTLGQYHVRYNRNANYIESHSPTGKQSEVNDFMDDLAQHMVFNLNSATNVTINTSVGIVLVPQKDSNTIIDGTSAGWIISNGRVHNNGAEWHSVYKNLPSSTKTNITVGKTVDGNTPNSQQTFVFDLTLWNGNDWEEVRSTTNANGAVAFNNIDLAGKSPGWYVFRIKENTDDQKEEYVYDNHSVYAFVRLLKLGNAKIAIPPTYFITADDGDVDTVFFNPANTDSTAQTLVGFLNNATTGEEIKWLNNPSFENAQKKGGLNFTKKVKGMSAETDTFTFRIKLEGLEIDGDTVEYTLKKTGVIRPEPITFTRIENTNNFSAEVTLFRDQSANIQGIPQNKHYVITEIKVNGKEITANAEVDGYTSEEIEHDGNISESYEMIQFINDRRVTGAKETLKANKAINGRSLKNGEFTFVLTASAQNTPEGIDTTKFALEASNDGSGEVDFGEIQFNDVGTWQFTVKEASQDGLGVTTDKSEYEVTFKTTLDSSGRINVNKTVKQTKDKAGNPVVHTADDGDQNGQSDITISFENDYFAAGSVVLEASKAADAKLTDNEFTFELYEGTKLLDTVTAKQGETKQFGVIEYTLEDEGEHTYTIKEIKGDKEYITYDDKDRTVTVTVTDDTKGGLEIEKVEPAGGVVFTNEYHATGSAVFSATKAGNELLGNKTFQFQLLDVENNVIQTSEGVKQGETATFDEIGFVLDDAGKVFTYRIREVIPDGAETVNGKKVKDGVTYDETVVEVKLLVADDHEGTLTVKYNGADTFATPEFTNTYDSEGSIVLGGTKFIEDRAFKAGDSATFKIEAITENAPLPEKTEVTVEPAEGTSVQYAFQEIRYKLDDLKNDDGTYADSKTFEYKVTESAFTMEGVLKDTTEYTVNITVDDRDQNGKLNVESDIEKDQLNFINTETSVKVSKLDAASKEELPGALLQIFDSADQEIAKWTSSNEAHEVKGLKIGETYRLHEEIGPDGYATAYDATFVLNDEGKVASTTGFISEDGVLLVEDVQVVYLSVQKLWDDDGNRDGIRPLSLTVTLYIDGEPSDTKVTLNAQNNWTSPVITKDRYRCDDTGAAILINYEWVEADVSDYKYELTDTVVSESEALDGGWTMVTKLTNKYVPGKTEVSVRKVWEDHDNKYSKRPDSIKVQLYADGKAFGDVKTLNAGNGWSYTWTDLDRCVNASGRTAAQTEIKYTVEEIDKSDDYVGVITGSQTTGFIITNTLKESKLVIEKTFDIIPKENKPEEPTPPPEENEETVDIPVVKTWNDGDDADGVRPASVTVRLLANGAEVASATLNAANGWAYTFTGMPKFSGEDEIAYTVTEDEVEGYDTEIDGFNVINTRSTDWTSVTVIKVWDDQNNKLKIRPASIRMTLSNGMSVVLNAANNWTATIDHLPTKGEDGKTIEYTWKEQAVLGYKLVSVKTTGTVTVFTNAPVKRPGGPGIPYLIIEEYGTPLGIEIIINHVGDCFD